MYELLRQIGPIALFVIWFSGQIVLYLWYRAKERPYLQRFPPVDGVPLDMVLPGRYVSSSKRAVSEVLRLRQADPELEQMRRAVRRRGFSVMLWLVVGFLLIITVLPPWVFMVSAR